MKPGGDEFLDVTEGSRVEKLRVCLTVNSGRLWEGGGVGREEGIRQTNHGQGHVVGRTTLPLPCLGFVQKTQDERLKIGLPQR